MPVIPRAPLPALNPKLPPVPEVRGPIEISITYPRAGQLIASRDSNFIFGSVGSGDAGLRINGFPVPVWPNGAFMGWLPVPPDSAPHYEIVASNGTRYAHLVHPIKLPPPPDTIPRDTLVGDTLGRVPPKPDTMSAATVVPIARPVYAPVGTSESAVSDTDRVSIARPAPGSGQLYKWFLLPGTVVKVTGDRNANDGHYARIELDSEQEAWVFKSELGEQMDSVAPTRQVGTVRIEPAAEWIDIVIPTGSPPPYLAEETDRAISLLVYGVTGAPVVSLMPEPADPYVASVSSSTPEPTRVRYTISLTSAPYGYLALWDNGALRFRVRRPPRIADRAAPLRGLTIAVDPGHPPAGATGPTKLYEGDAVLPVGLKLRDMLTARGANVVMTRTTPDPVDLALRPIIGRRANAHAFVSIHLNAFPDGVNPFENNGTLTLYFWPHSLPLGKATQAAMLAEMGLRDNGTKYQNLAVARVTWMPSILTEGAFVIMPDQEAAIRTPEYQEAYARSIMQGLEAYFASLAQAP
ncbi:MAG: N-acetylmuramoyl-L-alanine amidase [Gemmatimonadaceae bacterium]